MMTFGPLQADLRVITRPPAAQCGPRCFERVTGVLPELDPIPSCSMGAIPPHHITPTPNDYWGSQDSVRGLFAACFDWFNPLLRRVERDLSREVRFKFSS